MTQDSLAQERFQWEKSRARWASFGRFISMLAVLATLAFGFFEFTENQRQLEQDRLAQERESTKQRQFTLYEKFWQKRFDMYMQLCDAASATSIFMAKLSRASDEQFAQLVAQQKGNFWQLYYGSLCIVEDEEVEQKTVAFGKVLKRCEKAVHSGQKPTAKDVALLKKYAIKLAIACRQHISKYWIELEETEEAEKLEEFAQVQEGPQDK